MPDANRIDPPGGYHAELQADYLQQLRALAGDGLEIGDVDVTIAALAVVAEHCDAQTLQELLDAYDLQITAAAA